jgi:hypothetical protein
MTVIVFVVVAVSMMIMQGCSPNEGPPTKVLEPGVSSTANAAQRVEPASLEVTKLSLTREDLRLDYRVTNHSEHDIWVCVNMSDSPTEASKFTVETEIRGRTLQITRRGNVEQTALVNTLGVYAVYHRLQPGASRCDTVLLPLPVENWSHVRLMGDPVKPVVLNQVVLELGYFDQHLRDLISEDEGSRRIHSNAYFKDLNTAFISYIRPRRWDKMHLEQSVQIMISDVNVPGRIP